MNQSLGQGACGLYDVFVVVVVVVVVVFVVVVVVVGVWMVLE